MPPVIGHLDNFPNFSNLPVEIRLRIWDFAAPRRARVIQVGYDPITSCWKAWKDGLGGLPSIVHVSREARREALKSYSRIFDAFVDPEEDTIFLSDPIFAIRKPRSIFMSLESVHKLRNVAFTSEIYDGLARSFGQFPIHCEGPATILRKMKGLNHFALVLSEDGAGFEYSEDEDEDEDEDDTQLEADLEDEDEDSQGWGGEDWADAADSVIGMSNAGQELGDVEQSTEAVDENTIVEHFLDRLDAEAMEIMSRGFFRHLGNIHFESAMEHPDHWEDFSIYRDELELICEEEKKDHSDWIRPKVSVMAVEYGLEYPGFYITTFHLLGDHHHGELEISNDEIDRETQDENDSGSD